MANTKLEYFLTRVSAQQLKAFESSLLKSQKQKDGILAQLLRLLRSGEMTPEDLYGQLYPQSPYSSQHLRNLRSALFGKLTDFLAHQLFDESPEKAVYVAMVMNQLQATRHFPAIMDKYVKSSAEALLSLEEREVNLRLKAETLQSEMQEKGRRHLPFEELLEDGEVAFVARTLYFALAHQEAQTILEKEKVAPPSALWEPILARLEAGEWTGSPLIQSYFALYQLIRFPEDPTCYLKVKTLLSELGDRFTKTEARRMYTVMRNHCIRTLNTGNEAFLAELFHVFQEMRERELLLSEFKLSQPVFKTVISCAARLGQFDWANQLIEDALPTMETHTPYLHYARGVLAFHQNDLNAAESNMNRVLNDQQTDPFLGLDARSYLLRIYYENGNYTSMTSLLNSFRILLKRYKHLSPVRLENYKTFVRFFRRIERMDPNKPHLGAKMRDDLQALPYHASRFWFFAKLKELFPNA